MTPEEVFVAYRLELTRQIISAIRDLEGEPPSEMGAHIVELMELNGFFDPVKALYSIRSIFDGYQRAREG